MKKFLCFFLFLKLSVATVMSQVYTPKFDLQGHRGARGLKPENTIPSFIVALEAGVTTIELDVVITKDKQVVVSHEPWMAADICLKPDGTQITESEARSINIYQLTYKEVKQYDCGSKGNVRFPDQEKLKISKPLLKDVIASVEDHIKSYTLYEVDYNIEIKSAKTGDGKYHPLPDEFSDLVYNLLSQYLPMERIIIQSFDFRVLQYWHNKYPSVRLAALVENTKSIDENLKELGFMPSVYSPYYKLLTEEKIKELKALKLRVIPWTVNEPEDMKRLRAWGVDGLITDYPNRAAELGLGLKGKNGNGKKNGLR
ncbi:MAG: glycerophosphodiester phosphodiesterase [Cyclobacteriaceae bacterium]|nr:glycerophosphodiester phosphodiesterase [Cyclobacteriaceae bacterium]